jgi:hypothetical protein
MAPKSKSSDSSSGPAKLKPATSINVRHILCEKHSNKEKALARLLEGHKFDDVAKDLSEDKARQGKFIFLVVKSGCVVVGLLALCLAGRRGGVFMWGRGDDLWL